MTANRDEGRLQAADAAMQRALIELTGAICLLGISEGRSSVQLAHGLVQNTRQYLRHLNSIEERAERAPALAAE